MPTISDNHQLSEMNKQHTPFPNGSYGCLSGYNCQQGINNWWRHIDAFHRRKNAIDHSYIETLWRQSLQCIVPDELLQHKKAYLIDVIAATGLLILLKSVQIGEFFGAYGLRI